MGLQRLRQWIDSLRGRNHSTRVSMHDGARSDHLYVDLEVCDSTGQRQDTRIGYALGPATTISLRIPALSFYEEATTTDLWDALLTVRRRLERRGYLLLCNACRRDCHPSPDAPAMDLVAHTPAGSSSVEWCYMFDAADADLVGTIAQQQRLRR